MTKNDLIRSIAAQTDMTLIDVTKVIDHLPGAVVTGLMLDGEAILPGLGKMVLRPRPARTVRSPSTGEMKTIPPGKRIQFRPSKHLKQVADTGSE